MELLPALVFCSVLLCSNAQSQSSVVSADCNDTEKDAGVALDLINKHRRDGYVFSLLRVADAHVRHVENASIFYFTLDVLETECPVISRKHWESCEYGPFFGTTDFGRCNAVIYINKPCHKERLYGYNCTMSPVPPQLYECKQCPVRVTVMENVQQYAAEAERLLERYNQDSNLTKHFKVDKVTKVLLAVASRTGYRVEFTIKETMCPKTKLLSQMSGCEFLPDKCARTGFCIGRLLNGTKDPESVEVESCEIYDIQLGKYGRRPFHGHHHNDSREFHHPCNASRHGCRHRHLPPEHYHHHPRPPPHHRHRHSHAHYPCDPAGTKGHSNSSKESQEKDNPGLPPPPGPRYPPPPPGGPHHFPPSRFPPPPAGPPPRPGQPFRPPPFHHHPEGPDFRPPTPSPCGPRHGYHHDHRRNNAMHGREDSSSKEHPSFPYPQPFPEAEAGSVYRIPLASEHDVLQAPGPDFSFLSHGRYEKPVAQPFPLTPSKSESCPGKPIHDLSINLLSLYPPSPAH